MENINNIDMDVQSDENDEDYFNVGFGNEDIFGHITPETMPIRQYTTDCIFAGKALKLSILNYAYPNCVSVCLSIYLSICLSLSIPILNL